MILTGKRVKHKTLGVGVVSAQEGDILTIEFPNKTSKFQYNAITFTKFLEAEDHEAQAAILREFEEMKAAEKQKVLEVALSKQKEEEAKREELLAKHAPFGKTAVKKTTVRQERIPGKPMTFYVFQGETFDIESRAGFIWAPQHSQSGGNVFHWDNLLLVKEGDVVLHGCNGYVVAVSIAVSNCYECDRPGERAFEGSWNNEGRRVDLKYTTFLNPIKTSDFYYDILEYCKVKYSPFDKDGNGNMGYLYELNRELARIFLRAAVRNNPYLSDVDYIQRLLVEDTR